MTVAKVVRTGSRCAVHLPEGFSLSAGEVEIFWRGEEIVLRPIYKGLAQAIDILRQLPADAFEGIRDTRPPQEREGL